MQRRAATTPETLMRRGAWLVQQAAFKHVTIYVIGEDGARHVAAAYTLRAFEVDSVRKVYAQLEGEDRALDQHDSALARNWHENEYAGIDIDLGIETPLDGVVTQDDAQHITADTKLPVAPAPSEDVFVVRGAHVWGPDGYHFDRTRSMERILATALADRGITFPWLST